MKLNEENVLCENATTASSSKELCGYNVRNCIATILKLLSDFGTELKLGDSVLKISICVNAVDVNSFKPADTYNCLKQHISKLQSVSESLKSLADAEAQSSSLSTTPGRHSKAAAAVSEDMTSDPQHTPATALQGNPEVVDGKSQPADLTVQINASKSEIDRRIFAFMERKQLEINENNVREFCNVIDCNQENSCARTDAVFTPYPGFKSHVKVTRVVNTYGPQTRGVVQGSGPVGGEASESPRGPLARTCGNPAVEERLQNIESHLKLPTEGPVPQSVYQRLKKLEDRILELEGMSPEYFQSTSYLHKRPKTGSAQAYSLSELDGKISAVKAALLKRVTEFGPECGAECPL